MNQMYSICADVAFRKVDGKLCLIKMKTNCFMVLNSTGTAIMELMENRSFDAIIEQLVEIFDIERDKLCTEVQLFIEELIRRELIVCVSSTLHGE